MLHTERRHSDVIHRGKIHCGMEPRLPLEYIENRDEEGKERA